MAVANRSLYERDFHAWAEEQAALLRAGKLAAADVEHIAEEIESMGRSERRELVNRLTILLAHFLKWRFQPGHRGASWQATIRIQRRELADYLADNPSLRALLPEAMVRAYGRAAIEAGAETGLGDAAMPASCPWTFDETVDETFWPEG